MILVKNNTSLQSNQNLEKVVLYSVWVVILCLLKLKNVFAVGFDCSTFQKQPPEVFFEKGVMQQKYVSKNMHQVYRTPEV